MSPPTPRTAILPLPQIPLPANLPPMHKTSIPAPPPRVLADAGTHPSTPPHIIPNTAKRSRGISSPFAPRTAILPLPKIPLPANLPPCTKHQSPLPLPLSSRMRGPIPLRHSPQMSFRAKRSGAEESCRPSLPIRFSKNHKNENEPSKHPDPRLICPNPPIFVPRTNRPQS